MRELSGMDNVAVDTLQRFILLILNVVDKFIMSDEFFMDILLSVFV